MSLSTLIEYLQTYKGGPGSGHRNHSGTLGKRGGSRKGIWFRLPKPKKESKGDGKETKPNKKHKTPTNQIATKGSAGSGDWAHRGRPGKKGGSGGGGGLATLGLDPTTPVDERRRISREVSEIVSTKTASEKKLEEHYNLDKNCALNPVQCEALTTYTGSAYEEINGDLRNSKVAPPDVPDMSFRRQDIQAMDSAFEKFGTVPEDIKVHRSVFPGILDKLQPGTVFQDHGFVSTSLTKESALAGAVKMEIRVPKGSKGIYIDPISKFGSNAGLKDNKNIERELLLNRGSKFRILKNDGKNVIAELVND